MAVFQKWGISGRFKNKYNLISVTFKGSPTLFWITSHIVLFSQCGRAFTEQWGVWIEQTLIRADPNAVQLLGGWVFTKYIKVNLSISHVFPYSHLKLKNSVQQLFSFPCGRGWGLSSLWCLIDNQQKKRENGLSFLSIRVKHSNSDLIWTISNWRGSPSNPPASFGLNFLFPYLGISIEINIRII